MKKLQALLNVATSAACLWTSCHAAAASEGGVDTSSAEAATPRASTAETTQDTTPESWALHGQATYVTQFHPGYASPYRGPNSLSAGNGSRETADATLFAGVRLWSGAQAWVNPEADQGFGLNNTLGVAGFPSGEAYKVGAPGPYFRLPRAFIRQTIGLGDDVQTVAPAANQLGSVQSREGVTVTLGKFSVVDIFDTNRYAHDPRSDFLNWSIVDGGAFDYAADAWGYTYGSAVEWTRSWWTLRGGVFDLSRIPNSTQLERGFGQFALIGEFEERHDLGGHPGELKALGFVNRGRMGSYDDAVRAAQRSGTTPSVGLVRRYGSRPGMALNLEQELLPDLGVFARASANDGSKEAFEFTDINRSLAGGLSLRGERWNRADDTFGLAAVVNGISTAARRYFAAGGLGVLVGDGQLPHYGLEKIAETYYSMHAGEYAAVTVDYQLVVNPAYNRDRGPVSVFGLRLHAEF
jgi:high affinity Mn2+ porin